MPLEKGLKATMKKVKQNSTLYENKQKQISTLHEKRQPKIVSLDKCHPRNRYLKVNNHY